MQLSTILHASLITSRDSCFLLVNIVDYVSRPNPKLPGTSFQCFTRMNVPVIELLRKDPVNAGIPCDGRHVRRGLFQFGRPVVLPDYYHSQLCQKVRRTFAGVMSVLLAHCGTYS